MVKYDLTMFRIVNIFIKWSKMIQNDPKWLKLVLKHSRLSKMVKNGPNWSNYIVWYDIKVRIDQNGE